MITNLKVSIIIVNWNGYIDTLECLKSLENIEYPNYEVVIVDNGSTDNSVLEIKKHYPKHLLIETNENLGFAGGNNVGIRYALDHGTDQILLLNNDTVVDKYFLKKLVDHSISNQNIGIVGPLIYYFKEKKKLWWQGGNFDFWFNFCDYSFDKVPEKPYQSSFISGCALLIKKDVIEKIGLLNEDYFLYYEDADWCFRAKKEGYNCTIIPSSIIWHKVSSSSGSSLKPQNQYYFIRNKMLFAFRNFSIFKFVLFIVPYSLKFLGKTIFLFFTDKDRVRYQFKGFRDYWRSKFGKLEVDK